MTESHACPSAPTPRGITRRALFAGLAGTLAAVGFGSLAESAQAASRTYTVGSTASIPVGTAKFFTIGGRRVMVTQPTRGTFKAFSGNCTHRSVALTDPGSSSATAYCPVHFAQFSKTTGAVVGQSPAHTNLTRYTVAVASGKVKVTVT